MDGDGGARKGESEGLATGRMRQGYTEIEKSGLGRDGHVRRLAAELGFAGLVVDVERLAGACG